MSRATSSMRLLALRLMAHEAKGKQPADPGLPPALRVCEKLRTPLGTLMGQAGFRALLARALALAGAEVPWLRTVQVRADGSLEEFTPFAARIPPHRFKTDCAALVAELLGLLIAFIGERLTLQLVREIWPKLPVPTFQSGQGPIK